MYKKIIFFLLLCIMCLNVPGRAKSFDTVFLDLGAVNCPEKSALQVSGIVRGKVDRIKYCSLFSERSTSKTIEKNGIPRACYDRACAVRLAKLMKADRAVYGTVRVAAVTYNQLLGKEGAGKYLFQEKAVESYVITLYLVDVHKEAVIAAMTETAGINTVPRDTERLVAKLQSYFIPAGEARGEQSGKPGPALNPSWNIYAGPSGFIPLGSYGSMARGGAGFIAGAGVSNLAVRNSLLRIQAGYYFVFPKKKNVNSYHVIPLTLLAGYSFEVPKGFTIAPILGGGYILHIISEDIGSFRIPGYYRYSDHRYYDPHLVIRCDAAWHINDHFTVTVTPGYMIFFEKSGVGMAVDFTAGFRYTF